MQFGVTAIALKLPGLAPIANRCRGYSTVFVPIAVIGVTTSIRLGLTHPDRRRSERSESAQESGLLLAPRFIGANPAEHQTRIMDRPPTDLNGDFRTRLWWDSPAEV